MLKRWEIILFSMLYIFCTSAFASSTTKVFGDWKLETNIDPMNDERSLIASTQSVSGRQNLVVRCSSEKEIDIYVKWSVYVSKGDTHDLELRFDAEPSNHYMTNSSNDGKAQFINQWFNSYSTILSNIKSRKTMLAKTVPYGRNAVHAKFSLSGSAAAVNPVINACGSLPSQKHEYWRHKS